MSRALSNESDTGNAAKRKTLLRKMKQNWEIYVMMIPVVIFFLVFSYYPMYGIVLAFKYYLPSKGILGSEWVGLKHFEWLFTAPEFFRAFKNTLIISAIKLVFNFPVPIILALFLNEVANPRLKKGIQTAVYLPYFISWVIIGGIVYTLLSVNGGVVNNILMSLGLERVNFLTNDRYFYVILVLTEIWKGAGWGSVIYISAISSVSPELYEAATVDGCGRFRKMWNITIPCIMPIIVVMFILAVGNVMNAGFDQIFNLYNTAIYNVSDILDTYTYRIGISQGLVEKGSAIGLFKTVINFILLLTANAVVKRINGEGIYD
ncbi:MAG: ABC transporter permease [Christensenellales bacterium]